MLSKKINLNIYVNIISEWLTQKDIIIFDITISNFNEREYLIKLVYPVVNIKIFKIIKKKEKSSEIISKILFFNNRKIKYFCIYLFFFDKITIYELCNIFTYLHKNENITKLIIENCYLNLPNVFNLPNLFEKYSNINSLKCSPEVFDNYFKNNNKITEFSTGKLYFINSLFFKNFKCENLITFSVKIEKNDESMLIENLSIYFKNSNYEKCWESKLLNFLNTNECPI